MILSGEKLRELLVDSSLVDKNGFDAAVEEAKLGEESLQNLLIDKGLIRDDQLGQIISAYFGFPFINPEKEKVDEPVFMTIPELVARSRGVIAFEKNEEGIRVGMTDPNDLEIRDNLEKRFGAKVVPYYMTESGLRAALARYGAGLSGDFRAILEKLQNVEISRDERDEMIVRITDLLIKYGYQSKASDIHIEPRQKKVVVRFRVDGIMHDVLEVPKEFHVPIVTRIKILSRLRTDEQRSAQDGKFRYELGEEVSDVRVSIVPVTEGENVVMRLLSSRVRQLSLSDLGLSDHDFEKVKRAIRNPHGMILVTGPTGSGKTTTVYSFLKILNSKEVHISTIEDPVEYYIDGISQIQVNPQTNLTFASGLRAIVRQDPDIIMVGEIRDEETAGIAVNSAMTGHLVLSTLHANDAATTLPRLLDMGIEPFLIASTVNVAIAQRLVRKICQNCLESHQLSNDERLLIDEEPRIREMLGRKGYGGYEMLRLYRGKGCSVCGSTGFSGRIGIFEVLEMTEQIKKSIMKRSSSNEILELAREEKMTTMLEDGIDKVIRGATTLEEVIRVTRE